MDKQQEVAKINSGVKILFWLVSFAFFIYSFRTIMDLEEIAHPRRQESFLRILTALSQPNLFDYEYETRETSIFLEKSCGQADNTPQIERVNDGKIAIEFKCTSIQHPTFIVHGSGFQPGSTGHIAWDAQSRNEQRQTSTNFPFQVDKDGNFSITAILFHDGKDVIGREVFIIENLSKTFQGLSATSNETARLMLATLQIAFLATCISAVLATPFTFFSTRVSSWWGRAFSFLIQFLFTATRSVHPLITIVLAVVLVGIGATAGVLAITLFSTAVLYAKFSSYVEEHKSLKWSTLFTVHFPGIAFRHFPTNILIATVVGFMGGGGVGFILQQNINLLNYRDASVSILTIIITIGSLDLISRVVWRKIQNRTN
jgi:phosphonate transport system permease protein